MPSASQSQKKEPTTSARVAIVFKKFFYSQPVEISEMPTEEFFVSVENEQDVEVSQQKSEKSKETSFQEQVTFYPYLVKTKQNTIMVIGSAFSLYDHVSREPYLEIKAEYQFQQQLREALKLTGGHVYHLPGDLSDFVVDDIDLEDVVSRDLELKYEHDDNYFYLFVLI